MRANINIQSIEITTKCCAMYHVFEPKFPLRKGELLCSEKLGSLIRIELFAFRSLKPE